jgi:quinohemoprotein amine dehydrogenase
MTRYFTLVFTAAALAQTPPAAPKPEAAKEPSEPGIPVASELVKAKCAGCHRADDKGNLTRISWERTTPEGWQQIIKRMVRLNGLTLTPAEARDIVKSLSDSHGLAPEEAKPVAWYWEKRQIETETPLSDTLRDSCAACHPLAQPNSWRRSKEEWSLLASMHRGYFPVVEFTSFRRPFRPQTPPAPTGRGARAATPAPPAPPADPREPFEIAIEEFSKSNPLQTPEWADWQATRREPKLAGRWAVSAYLPGKGKFVGEMTVAGSGDDYTTSAALTSLKTGEKVTRSGRGVVYTGYAWRGSSKSGANQEREVMAFSRDQQSAEGRWFWGGYNEFGYDVTMKRAGDGPVLLTTDVHSLPSGESTVKIFGDRLPTGLKPADIDFGKGVSVTQVVAQTPSAVTVKVNVDSKAVTGRRDVSVRRTTLTNAVAVYQKIDYIKTPGSALARLGGTTHPKGYFQFEAIGWSNGLDGKPDTADDVALGPVAAQWSMEEFFSRYGDDDKEYVGSLSAEGLFTPSIEGPNEKRKFGSNNFGEVWVIATYKPTGAEQPLTSRTYFVVTVPQYMRWDQPEVAQ